jgi:protein-tyrosine-phosphatase
VHILFVCTGNICRSPMAEGIARDRFPDLATYSSAGTVAVRGSTPTTSAVSAAAEIGVDISELRAGSLRKGSDPLPDQIYVMTHHHLDRVVTTLPGLAERVQLLDPQGEIADPYGYDIDVYRATRDQIIAAIEARAPDWTANPA